MKGPIQRGLRQLTKVARPLALRSAGRQGSGTAVVRHIGRKTGRSYETPIVAVEHDGTVYVALPYGEHTDWLRNVLARGSTTVVNGGERWELHQPEVIPMAVATSFFGAKEQRLHRRFGVELCLQMHRV